MLNFDFLFRKKTFSNQEDVTSTNLQRVLGLWDITAIGISSTLGSGIYVLAGTVITSFSGPSIILSFIVAGIATFLSGMCYAELGARVPRSGSAYVYIYVTIGEMLAFIMGWDLILEYVIGSASVANALSQYVDSFAGRKIRAFLSAKLPLGSEYLGTYPDFLAFAFVIIVTGLMIIGVKESARLNKLFTLFNITILSVIIIGGATKTHPHFWHVDTKNLSWIDSNNQTQNCSTTSRCGEGGFMPWGVQGMLNGAAKCFFAFIGFDAIASTGEEVLNPKRNIPISILITLIVVGILYCGLSTVLTLMIPYYLLDADTPIPDAFEYAHLHSFKYVVSVGAVMSLCTCLYAGMFPMPRVIYSMASDGLIFRFLSKVTPGLKTPYMASIIAGLMAGILSMIFNLNELVDMMSIGTLMAYSLVSICVLILRYKPPVSMEIQQINKPQGVTPVVTVSNREKFKMKHLIVPIENKANLDSYKLVNILAVLSTINILIMSLLLSKSDPTRPVIAAVIGVLAFLLLVKTIIIWRQPQDMSIQTFKAPFIPFLPIVSVFINIYMMTTLTEVTWIRFLVWFAIGLIVYYCYGIRNSDENKFKNTQSWIFPCYVKKSNTVGVMKHSVQELKVMDINVNAKHLHTF